MCCRRGTRLAADRRVFAAITDVSGFARPGRKAAKGTPVAAADERPDLSLRGT